MLKNNELKITAILTLCLIVFASPLTAQPAEPNQPVITTIILLHDNDNHFDFNFPNAFKEKVNSYREKYDNVFLLNGGDIFVRHSHRWKVNDISFYEQRSKFMIETMNEMGYDVLTLGNHELDYKGYVTRDALRMANFDIIAANLEIETDKLDKPKPYTILETVEGYTVAVLGLTIGGAENVKTTSPKETVENYMHLREKNNVFIALTHIGYQNDKSLAQEFSEIDVIIGAHSHTLLNPARTINGVLVAQAGGHPHEINISRPKRLGVVRLVLEDGILKEKSGKVLSIEAELEQTEEDKQHCIISKAG